MRKSGSDAKADRGLASRRPWVRPEVRRVRAGDAENGPDPIIPDGPISFGS